MHLGRLGSHHCFSQKKLARFKTHHRVIDSSMATSARYKNPFLAMPSPASFNCDRTDPLLEIWITGSRTAEPLVLGILISPGVAPCMWFDYCRIAFYAAIDHDCGHTPSSCRSPAIVVSCSSV